MLSLCRTVLLSYFLSILVECSHPGSLTVRKLNRQLIARKRQNTLDLCQMFNVENEKMHSELTHNRLKRAAATPSPADRVERLVDKLYDEPEDGEQVAYRKKNIATPKAKASKSGRRFDFAPGLLEVDIIKKDSDNGDLVQDGKTIPVPWHKYWKHGIVPYFIDSNTYDTFLAEKIIKAFDNFEQNTCIRLQRLRERPTDKESLQRVQWLYITNPSGTRQCVHSNEMKTTSGVQMVVFGYDCMSEGQIMHEVMHILGFSHEHVREDRDKYVSVMWDNIKPGYKKFFEIKQRPLILSSLPYDYASVLHYPPRAFSKNGKFTLITESGGDFGQREGLSDIDIEKVSMIYSGECIERNKHYLVTTCPTVIATKVQKNTQKATQQEIEDYFRDRLWPYGIVNYKLKDKIEFSIEERQNIEEVIKHIEKETCIEFRDFSNDDDVAETATETNKINDDTVVADDGSKLQIENTVQVLNQKSNSSMMDGNDTIDSLSDSSDKSTTSTESDPISDISTSLENNTVLVVNDKKFWANMTKRRNAIGNNAPKLSLTGKKSEKERKQESERNRVRRAVPPSPARRHADGLLVLSRSSESGCRCPEPGRVSAQKELVITADCFNSVNDLLHVFVHVLGLEHQHNSHDRDDFLAINWTNVTSPLKDELENKLPSAASVGFAYDYQSVMHYPWLDIKNGVTNIMYPVWIVNSILLIENLNVITHGKGLVGGMAIGKKSPEPENDGWAMGHWQGLSSIDVQKLNLLYFSQCQSRKKHMAELLNNKKKL